MTDTPDGPLMLSIDIGGTRLKAGVLDPSGKFVAGPSRALTPHDGPAAVVRELLTIIAPLGRFQRISVGFPGIVRRGSVITAPNLGTPYWRGFPLARQLSERLGSPVRLLNDATVQGLGVIAGHGVECVITLGTGFGFALFTSGRLAPHLEMGQHIARGKRSYDAYLGNAELARIGRKRWNRRLEDKTLPALDSLINYDVLYIGGGNAKLIRFDLPDRVQRVDNTAGITGGVRLWDPKLDEAFAEAQAEVDEAARPERHAEGEPELEHR